MRSISIMVATGVLCFAPLSFAQSDVPDSGATSPDQIEQPDESVPVIPDATDEAPMASVTGVIERVPGDAASPERLGISSAERGMILLNTETASTDLEQHVGEKFTIEGRVETGEQGIEMRVVNAYPAEPELDESTTTAPEDQLQ